MPPDTPRVSVVICTDGRAAALRNTLDCLRFVDGLPFEVCVVTGPTRDGTDAVVAGYAGRIKLAGNPQRNLSVSRNLGLALAAAEIVAFIDDDALPEPEWLTRLAAAFDDPALGGAGGIVMDHTGVRLQYAYATADRLGNADLLRTTPAEGFDFPLSFSFPHVLGANSAFRRSALLDIGGFDEEFDFYLDETDVCCRLVDAGWRIRQLSDAVVHHKFLPSAIRTADRVTRVLYPVLKNKLYFSLVNNRGHYAVRRAIEDMGAFVAAREADLRASIAAGLLKRSDLDAFHADADRAYTVGLARGLSGERRLLPPSRRTASPHAPLPFPRPQPPGGAGTFVFISREYPPAPINGIGRYVHQMARAVAAIGHHVHVVSLAEDHDRVDFEDCVWVHRTMLRPDAGAAVPGMPVQVAGWARTALAVLQEIGRRHRVTAAYAPIWDCEGAAILADGAIPLVLGLQTSLRLWLGSNPQAAASRAFVSDFVQPMLALERHMLQRAAGVHAISGAIAREIERAYDVVLRPPRTAIVPLGMDDWAPVPAACPETEGLRLLFVGRLEARKGIDVLLDVLPGLLRRHAGLSIDIAGDDTPPGPCGRSYRAAFEAASPAGILARCRFHGRVSEDRLRALYRGCTIFVAPSRFESFGLIVLEAMMFAKPVVACRTGGMAEVAEHGRTALLAEPGDASTLEACLERLVSDPALREALGRAGRAAYEARFTPAPMAHGVVAILRAAARAMADQAARC